MIWGGLGQKREKKNSTATRPGKKKLNSTTRKKKKVQRLVAEAKKSSTASCRGKKTQREFSARGPPPRSLMVRPLAFPLHCMC